MYLTFMVPHADVSPVQVKWLQVFARMLTGTWGEAKNRSKPDFREQQQDEISDEERVTDVINRQERCRFARHEHVKDICVRNRCDAPSNSFKVRLTRCVIQRLIIFIFTSACSFLQSFSSTGLSLAIDKWVPFWEDVLCSADGADAKPSAK